MVDPTVFQPAPVTVMIDAAVPQEETIVVDELPDECPRCGSDDMVFGYGLAGGGFGSYLACECGALIKEMEPEE